jgi:hypothetical protein
VVQPTLLYQEEREIKQKSMQTLVPEASLQWRWWREQMNFILPPTPATENFIRTRKGELSRFFFFFS